MTVNPDRRGPSRDRKRVRALAPVINAITGALGHEDIAMPATPQAVRRAAQKPAMRMAAE